MFAESYICRKRKNLMCLLQYILEIESVFALCQLRREVLRIGGTAAIAEHPDVTAGFERPPHHPRWLHNPGAVKPGNKMAKGFVDNKVSLTTEDELALVAYLESLK